MEKIWDVTILVWNTKNSSKENAAEKVFRVFAHTEEDAKLRGLIDAAKDFPIPEGWSYDKETINAREVSREEIGNELDQRRAEIAQGSQERIDRALDDLETATGFRPNKPE